LYAAGEAAGLDEPAIAAVADRAASPTTLDQNALGLLVDSGVVSDEQARYLGTIATVAKLAAGDVGLACAVGAQVPSVNALAAIDTAEWTSLVRSADPRPLDGRSPEEVAAGLERAVTELMPTQALLARIAVGPAEQVQVRVAAMDEDERRRFVNAYPGLGISEILDDEMLSEHERVAAVTRRVGLLEEVARRNPGLDLLALDYVEEGENRSIPELGGLDESERVGVLAALKAYQRVMAVTGSASEAKAVVEAGYRGSAEIIGDGPVAFKAKTGLSEAAAGRAYDQAQNLVQAATSMLGTTIDVVTGGFVDLPVGNVAATVLDRLRGLSGFSDLFGSQAQCRCEHCESILGPAAYFVDLLWFVNRSVLSKYFGDRPGHLLNLKLRRPDLWTLPLTCQNTNERVATLEIVDEVLENYIAQRGGYAGDLTDRPAVEKFVYQRLADRVDTSFRQPFWLPLERLDTYLRHVGRTRGDLARVVGGWWQPMEWRTACTLGLAAPEYQLVTQPATLAALRTRYGVQFETVAPGVTIKPVDVQLLLGPVGVTREELGRLLAARQVVGTYPPFEIRAERASSESVQNDVERVYGLTETSLDVLHRFVRLWRKLPWSIEELDLALGAVGATGEGVTEAAVQSLAGVRVVQERLGMAIEEVCALVGPLPERPAQPDGAPLADRLFNVSPFAAAPGRLPDADRRFLHPAYGRAEGIAGSEMLPRLLAGLRVDDATLAELIVRLQGWLGAWLDAPEVAQRSFTLSNENLTLLYRHVRLAEYLDLSVADLFRLLALAGQQAVQNLDDVQTLLSLRDWWQESGYSLSDLAVITGTVDPVTGQPLTAAEQYLDSEATARELVAEIAAEGTLTFADSALAFLPGVTEEQSRVILAANPQAIVMATSGRLRLADGADLNATLEIPPGTAVSETDVRAALRRHHPEEIVPTHLGAKLGVSAEKARALLAIAGASLADPAVAAALRGGVPPEPLIKLLASVVPFSVLFKADVWDARALVFAHDKPAAITGSREISRDLRVVRRLCVYSRLAARGRGETPTPESRVNDVDIQAVLAAFTSAQHFDPVDPEQLGRALGADPRLTRTVASAVPLPDTAIDALDMLDRAVALARDTGCGGEALRLVLLEDYDSLNQLADAVLGAFRVKYDDEARWQEVSEPYEDRILARRRDALVDYLTAGGIADFAQPSDLYNYFLLDVQLDSCARTSRVAAAISSVQLYVHRCLLNLEQDTHDPGDPAHVHVLPSDIPAAEWDWRKNYRVWEANRKVFLWPENYIEPELRDDKTPLYEELETSLLQRDIDDDAALQSYSTYLQGLDELGRLSIAGTYLEGNADCLYLFGVTRSDPPVHYFRTVQNYAKNRYTEVPLIWTPWYRIDMQIPAREVALAIAGGRLHALWCEYTTRSLNKVSGGGSDFIGYAHTMTLRYTKLQLDGSWSAPQRIHLTGPAFPDGAGVILDPRDATGKPKYADLPHPEPRDDYTLSGPSWRRLYCSVADSTSAWDETVSLAGRNFLLNGYLDVAEWRWRWSIRGTRWQEVQPGDWSSLGPFLSSRTAAGRRSLRVFVPKYGGYDDGASALLLDERCVAAARLDSPALPDVFAAAASTTPLDIATIDPEAELLPIESRMFRWSGADALLQSRGDTVLLSGRTASTGKKWLLRRIGTTLADGLAQQLYQRGIAGLLATGYQLSLAEKPVVGAAIVPAETFPTWVVDQSNAGTLDFTGPYGVYFREVFFHVPFLIANVLNSCQRFADAQRWYQYIFDPTAFEQLFRDFHAVACSASAGTLHVAGITHGGLMLYRRRTSAGQWAEQFEQQRFASREVAVAADPTGVHACRLTAESRLCYMFRPADGEWQDDGEITYQTGDLGPVAGVACAVEAGVLQVCAIGMDGRLWRAVRQANGSWERFIEVTRQPDAIGKLTSVACAVDAGSLHVCGLAATGRIWHTVRKPDGSWQPSFTDVASQAGAVGTFTSIGCAANAGSLHLAGVTADGRLWHALRRPDGTWAPFTDVEAQAGEAGRGTAAACATEADSLHVCVATADGRLPHTVRRADGSWTPFDDGAQAERDRLWRYREFRGLDLPRLRQVLTDAAAIAVYRKDPFNPHAIARLRLSAYQKRIVMKYVDNLLDWGDSLYTEFLPESINEATLLYSVAAEILGERPVELGECGLARATPPTYALIEPRLSSGSEFLIELESMALGREGKASDLARSNGRRYVLDDATIRATSAAGLDARDTGDQAGEPAGAAGTALVRRSRLVAGWRARAKAGEDGDVKTLAAGAAVPSAEFGVSLAAQLNPVFCIPGNTELRSYWDRVEDRLQKIRSCRDIAGVRRELELFAPELDPRLLVRMRAAGLSMEEVLQVTSGNLPPYRFTYLIERAKAAAATVQSFGAAMLGAVEKKDLEELTRLRATHEQNLLLLTTRAREREIEEANQTIEALQDQEQAAEYRRDYYRGLAKAGLTAWETTQSLGLVADSVIRGGAAGLQFLSSVLGLLPDIGSPFAMKYGGTQTERSPHRMALATDTLADIAQAVASSAGLEAGFGRRRQEWDHQAELAQREADHLAHQAEAARIRKIIAERSLELHEKSITNANEILEFYGEKFSSLGLYTWLSATLHRLYRDAYNSAFALAKLAEQAFRFERDEDDAVLGTAQWDASRAGLLAGERLQIELQDLERRFLETNYRALEVDQSFSLAQLDPAALVCLRETGTCDFSILETHLDLFYPGHYRRRIKGVRLTIPCVTGPYVNVGATLRLLESRIRTEPQVGPGALKPVPRQRSVQIATSTSQHDGGVFEMNFKDERYMPFEGAGVVSSWRLSLPKSFRPFDYQTISDVILTIAYTAEANENLRNTVEQLNAQLEGTLLKHLASEPLARLLSLRQDFSVAFSRLLHSPPNTPVELDVTRNYFPVFLASRNLKPVRAMLLVRTTDHRDPGNLSITLDDAVQTEFKPQDRFGGLYGKDVTQAITARGIHGMHTLAVKTAGALGLPNPPPGDTSAVDANALADLMLHLEYTAT
jgi:hypothetical protein